MLTTTSIALDASTGSQRTYSTNTPETSTSPPSTPPSSGSNPPGLNPAVSGQNLPAVGSTKEAGQLQQAVSDINAYVQNLQRNLQFKVDTTLGITIISIVDSKTKEVVQQIPSEQVIESAHRLKELEDAGKSTGGLLFRAQT